MEQQLLGDICASVDQMLAVVEDQQQLLLCEVRLQSFQHGASTLLGQVENAPNRLGHQCRICQRRKLYDPDAVACDKRLPMADDMNADLGRQAGLPHPPTPVSVIRRWLSSSDRIASSS